MIRVSPINGFSNVTVLNIGVFLCVCVIKVFSVFVSVKYGLFVFECVFISFSLRHFLPLIHSLWLWMYFIHMYINIFNCIVYMFKTHKPRIYLWSASAKFYQISESGYDQKLEERLNIYIPSTEIRLFHVIILQLHIFVDSPNGNERIISKCYYTEMLSQTAKNC